MPHMEGIFINGEKAKFHPEDILDTDASQYTEEIGESVTAYLTEHLANPSNPPIDTSLSIAGAAADAKETGDQISQLKSDLSDTVIKPISLTMSNGKINPQGVVGGGDAGGYYKVSQAIDVSMASKIRIYNYYYGSSIGTVTVLGKTGNVVDFLLNPASGNDYVDFTIPDNGEVAYVQGTSSKTPTVVIYTSSDSIDRKISTMENTIEKEFSSYLIDDGANWRE